MVATSHTVFESGLPGGSSAGTAPITVTGSITVGDPDGLADIRGLTIAGIDFPIGAGGLTELLAVSVNTDFGTLTITSVAGGVLGFSYVLNGAVVNSTEPGATDLSYMETIPVTVRDGLSSASADIQITIVDSVPDITGVQNAAVDNEVGLSVTGHISASAPDTIASFDLSPSLANAPAGLSYALQADGSLLAKNAGGESVFSLSINSNGDYTFTALRDETSITAGSPDFRSVAIPAGQPMVSMATSLYSSYTAAGVGIGQPVTSVTFSSESGKLNPSADGLGIGNNLIDNPRTAPAEVLRMQFADSLSDASLHIGNISKAESLVWKVYLNGELVDSGNIGPNFVTTDGTNAQTSNSESPTYWFDLSKNGLDPGLRFDSIEISGNEGSSYKFIAFSVERPVLMQDLPLTFGVVATDGDGDQSAVANFTVNLSGSDNVIHDTAGDTVLTGGEGADVFQWTLAESGAHDTVTDFNMAAPSSGGDILNIQDLLPPESVGNLGSYLRFEQSGEGGTLLKVSHEGSFTGDAAHDAGVSYQSIDLQHVDLTSLGGSQQQIIDSLLASGKLITG